ncbi:hypothetical protein NEOLEDRAFT_1181981 [Neolentinus lepideus HHB14362 ss-1]|uniref:Pali-domain-containing protein n=1 Tax=Neolentinus lepideus HHB14362 ss-1 TaxID=1314782 RepID=A0A165PHK2_9AGAM|nr:hypothetical protein NEOLEDRAFT_1181981 [Neolentinus lepideus HHB14362 ss-1]
MLVPLRHHPVLSLFIHGFFFVAFLLFFLVALSLPIIKTIYLLTLHAQPQANEPATNVATEVQFGVWGFCATSVLNPPTWLTNPGDCVGPQLGYRIDNTTTLGQDILLLTGYPQIVDAILESLTVILVLHPVAAGLSFIVAFTSLFLESHAVSTLSLVIAIITALLGSLVFAIDLALVIVAMNEVKNITIGTFTITFGNAVWMVLVGMVLTWAGVIALSARVCYCCGVRPADDGQLKPNRNY